MVSGAVDTLSKMETKQAQDMLTKLEENMAGISEEEKENGGMEFDVDGGKEKGGTAGERRKREGMPLGCEESGSSSGGGEWAWWSGAWWVKTKTKMNSASRRKVHRAISQSLGKASEKNKLCEEKTSGTDDDDAKSWRKLGKPEQMMFDSKKSRRPRDEQADSANGVAHFRNASRAEGACVDTPVSSSGTQFLSKVARSWPGTCCLVPVVCFTETSQLAFSGKL